MVQLIGMAEPHLGPRMLTMLKAGVVAGVLTIIAASPSYAQTQQAAIHNPYDPSHQGIPGLQEQWLFPRHNHWQRPLPPVEGRSSGTERRRNYCRHGGHRYPC